MASTLQLIGEDVERVTRATPGGILRAVTGTKVPAVARGAAAVSAPLIATTAVAPQIVLGAAKKGTIFLGKKLAKPQIILGAPVVAGTLAASPKARKVVGTAIKRIFDPVSKFEAGKELGRIIEGAKNETTTKEKIKDIAKKAGLGAAAAAAVAAAIPAVREKVKERVKSMRAKPIPAPPITRSTLSDISPERSVPAPISAVQAPQKVEEAAMAMPPMPEINNKVTVKPTINVKVTATGIRKRFINQQNIIRR